MIKLEQVTKRLKNQLILDKVNMEVPFGKRVVVLGPSGAGKTVLLKIMAGLISPDSGRVIYSDQINGSIQGKIGFVFQGGALFDSLTVAENIALPLRERSGLGTKEIREKVNAILSRVGLEGAGNLRIGQLSGGMVRLVAIARALVNDPAYLFFDEPTSGLDPVSRERICQLISEVCAEQGKTAVVVTHDLEVAQKLGEKLYLLKERRLRPAMEIKKEDYELSGA